jgi:gag-polypeptide of LTR copia-type
MAKEGEKKDTSIDMVSESSNPSSPYFIHHSDSPGITLVSQPLTENNYPAWSRAIKIALSAKNKLGFIIGTVSELDSESAEYPAWERCNTMVLS